MKKVFPVLFMFFFGSMIFVPSALGVNINTATNFPDPDFRQAVEEFMNVAPGGEFSDQLAILKTGKLVCSNRKISSVTGIELFPGITELDCSSNNLSVVDLSRNTSLVNLNLDVNQLKALDLSKLTKLQSLNCVHNVLESLDTTANTLLKNLMIRWNRFSSIDTSKNAKLEFLDIGGHYLGSIDVRNNPLLKSLAAPFNNLRAVDLSNNKNLIYLQLNNNLLESIDLSDNPSINHLRLNDNNLRTIDALKNLSQLKIFDVRNNFLECDDIETINNFKAKFGLPLFDQYNDIQQGFGYIHQKGINIADCGRFTPTPTASLTPVPVTPTPVSSTLIPPVIKSLKSHSNQLWSIDFSPDGTMFASSSEDKKIRLYDSKTFEAIRTLSGHDLAPIEVKFSPDSTELLSAGEDDVAKLWNVKTGALIKEYPESDPHLGSSIWSVDFSPDGKQILTGSENGFVKLRDKQTSDVVLNIKAHNGNGDWGWTYTANFSPDGKKILTASHREPEHSAKLWDSATGELLVELIGHSGIVGDGAFSPDGSVVATTSNDGTIKIWVAATGENIKTLPGNTVATTTGTKVMRVADSSESWNIRFSCDGNYVLASNHLGNAKLWDINKGMIVKEFPSQIYAVAFSPDMKMVATGDTTGNVTLWDIKDLNIQFPTPVVTATPTPTRTPTPTNTPVPSPSSLIAFDGDSLESNQLNADPPSGYTMASVNFNSIPSGSLTDAKGMEIRLAPGQGVFVVSNKVFDANSLVRLSGSFLASDSGVSLALVALNSPIDGQLAYTNLFGDEIPVGDYRNLCLFYQPPSGKVQFAVQAVNSSFSTISSTVWVDNLNMEKVESGNTQDPLPIEVDGSFEKGFEKLSTNLNGTDGTISAFFETLTDVAIRLSIKPENLAANIGTTLIGTSDKIPMRVLGKVDVSKEDSSTGGMIAFVMTNGYQNLGLFRYVKEIPSETSNQPETLILGGDFTVNNPSVPLFLVIQNGGPNEESAIVVDNLRIMKQE